MTALVLALVLAASPKDTLVVGVLADPVTLAPHQATDLVGASIVVNVCETLVRYRPDGRRPEAALATTWATADRRVWTFTLRKGVRFHDGAPLDADSVVANLDDLRRARAFPGRARRIGPHVVEIALDQPNAALLATLSQPFFCIESTGRPEGALPVGTGPFRVISAEPGRVELQAHPGYWGGAPRLARLVFRRLPGEDALVEALVKGEVDVTTAVGQDRLARLHERPEVTLDSRTGLNLAFLSINNERPPFSDVRVRQALARAIDRDALVRGFLAGHAEPARNPLPPLIPGYDTRAKALHLDRAGARGLLAEAGFPGGLEASLLAVSSPRAYLPSPLRMAERIQADLAEVGVKLALREAPSWTDYVERATRGDYDLCLLGWQADTPDPNDFLSALLASEAIGTTNRSRYRSPAMDAVLKRARMGGDMGERLAAYREAQELFRKDMPWIPLYHGSVFTAYRKGVRGLLTGPTGVTRYEKAWKRSAEMSP
jgi:peptide/nickel transport system substrate-binding protein